MQQAPYNLQTLHYPSNGAFHCGVDQWSVITVVGGVQIQSRSQKWLIIGRKQMEEVMFSSQYPPLVGEPAYQTEWVAESEQNPTAVQVYSSGVLWQGLFMRFSFDLRFKVTPQGILFATNSKEIAFKLPRNDQIQWKGLLKGSLNQTDFHEQFRPIKKIGKGNFASVYLVEKVEDGSRFAVKAFSKEAAYGEENGKECLVKEIEIMRALDNRHNMKLCEVFESEHSLYIVFELLQGGQLYDKIKAKEKFKPKDIRRMVRNLLDGLRQMHSKKIMHRDLKPENILFRGKTGYDCVIGDYGLAEFSHLDEYLFVRCGTPGYVAPEVINIRDMKKKYSPVCDMFSLGLIFHLLLFGKSVFKGKSYNQVLKENRACSFNLDSEEYSQVDPIVMDLLKKMLKTNPEERITADQALCHPFFKDEEEEEMVEEVGELVPRASPIGQSPILTTADEERRKNKALERDSCLSFKMGKDNIINGKTETVGSLESQKISGFGAGLLKGIKASKFTKPAQKENKSATAEAH